MKKLTCLCRVEMAFLMDNKKDEVWQCPACHRLLYRSKVSSAQAWYVPEANLEVNRQLKTS
ncbi:MAG TPA: hypothetical protein G4O12_06255 [Dehalococcoidia bacterium]|nr:hypothetical protein [Dehalococcoidia bacterium]